MELYKKYRPQTLDQMVGQPEAVALLKGYVRKNNVPQAILFSGPSGTGKTTAARIMARELGIKKETDIDFDEINMSLSRGIDTVREMAFDVNKYPMNGKARVWILDEIHNATRDAWSALLKLLEDSKPYCYFFLCTTDPEKLPTTLLTRCVDIRMLRLASEVLGELLAEVAGKENIKLTKAVSERVVELAGGSARQALQLLGQIAHLGPEPARLEDWLRNDEAEERRANEIAKLLLKPGVSWHEVVRELRKGDEDPDAVRRRVMSQASRVLLRGEDGRAYRVLVAFDRPFFGGRASLVRACYSVVSGVDL